MPGVVEVRVAGIHGTTPLSAASRFTYTGGTAPGGGSAWFPDMVDLLEAPGNGFVESPLFGQAFGMETGKPVHVTPAIAVPTASWNTLADMAEPGRQAPPLLHLEGKRAEVPSPNPHQTRDRLDRLGKSARPLGEPSVGSDELAAAPLVTVFSPGVPLDRTRDAIEQVFKQWAS